ncbi:MAG: hypothetical protein ACKVX7_02955 [Planctomycetota bacterium]
MQTIGDPIGMLDVLFLAAGPIPPLASCGPDPTPDALGCVSSGCP